MKKNITELADLRRLRTSIIRIRSIFLNKEC